MSLYSRLSRHFPVEPGTTSAYNRVMSNTRENDLELQERLLLRADEVARRLSLGRATVYLMMASGELPTLRKGRAVRVPLKALTEWVERQTKPAA
jgi:excisionase family DNA binding protein